MNYEAIEKAIVEKKVKMFIQCSPHNPAGRVWSEEELDKVLAICQKHHVLVVSDEIHQDFVLDGKTFVPAAVVAGGKYRDIVLTVNSASKTFNLATLLHAHIIITNETLRKTYDKFASGMNRTEVSIMGMVATQAGYEEGAAWLEQVKNVIQDNYRYLKEELGRQLPKATVCSLEGTYLVLLDLRAYAKPEEMVDFVQKKSHLGVDYGEWFGDKYHGFIRLNLATDPQYVKQAVANLVAAAKK
jgi:cystathionine beta-lyase